MPDEKKGKSHLLEKTSSQPGRKGRAASTTPAKKARIAAGHHDSIGTPTLTSPLKPTVEAALNTTPVPTIKLEQSLTVHVPPPGPISSGVITPTAVAPQLLASMNNTTLYSRADLWRHALRKKRGDIAAVAKLVPVSEGVADPEGELQCMRFICQGNRLMLSSIMSKSCINGTNSTKSYLRKSDHFFSVSTTSYFMKGANGFSSPS